MDVDIEKAERAVNEHICAGLGLALAEAANGIIKVVNSNMVRAIRSVSVEKGYDVREFTIMAFGGAGPLHACEVAEQMEIREVLVPPSPGTLCSLGLLLADTKFDLSQTRVLQAVAENLGEVNRQFGELEKNGKTLLDKEGVEENRRHYERFIDLRYDRQNFEITIPVPGGILDEDALQKVIAAFHQEHRRSYGYCNEKAVVQMINFRLSAVGEIDKPSLTELPENPGAAPPQPVEKRPVLFQNQTEYITVAVYRREGFKPGCTLAGPAILEQMDTTIAVPPSWTIRVDGFGNLRIRQEANA
jgi:N-methylhydantoinase A